MRSQQPGRFALAGAALALFWSVPARAQPPNPAPVGPPAQAPAAAETPNPRAISAEAPIVAGNAASAKQRALDDAFRQAVERTFGVLMAEAGFGPTEPPPPALMQLKGTFFSRAKRYVRGYHVLEQSEEGGHFRLQIDAEIDEGLLRKEIDRARGSATPSPAATALSAIVVGAPPDAVQALARALGGAGVKTTTPVAGSLDDTRARELAVRDHAAATLVVSGNVADEGAVRGTTKWAANCRLGARVLAASATSAVDRTAEAHAFSDGPGAAQAECLARAAGDVARQTSGALGGTGVAARDMRLVSLELDLIEPAALPLVLQALKKLGNVSSVEVRRVTVGHVELRAVTRVAAPTLASALARELAGSAELVVGQTAPDRASVQVRLAAPVAPAAPVTPTAPTP
jgi:hypothetical protein